MPALMIYPYLNPKESYNSIIIVMQNDIVNEKGKQIEASIVIADECGDSMWGAVLGQEVKACQITEAIHNPNTLINKIETVQVVENDNTK